MALISSNSLPAETAPVNRVPTAEKLVALTFDDGPEAQTLELMKLIEAAGGRATFFVTGKNVQKHPEIVRAASEAGHEIGNHSFSHAHLPQLSPEEVKREILDTQALVEKTTGRPPAVFRAPFLEYNDSVFSVLREVGLPAINGAASVRDWDKETTVEDIIERATENLAPGNVVIMHSWPENTLKAMPELLRILREKGYRLVTVSDLLATES